MKTTIKGLIAGVSAISIASHAGSASAAPVWERGDNLGRISTGASIDAEATEIARAKVGAQIGELKAASRRVDQLGKNHIRLRQEIDGKPVFGADLVVHAEADGRVYLVNGRYVKPKAVAKQAKLNADQAIAAAAATLGLGDYSLLDAPELSYAVGFDGETIHLAWRTLVEYRAGDRVARDYIYADALTGAVAAVDPTIHYAKVWRTYDAQRAAYNSASIPGVLLCSGTQACGPTDAQDAHDGASATYDYYFTKFGRDSLNNAGFTLISSINVCNANQSNCTGWNNAAWIGTQMIYGDGDGVTFSPLSGDIDVVAHELTHGVTDFTSNLVYANASGALNEALSDIFGASVEAWLEGGVSSNTWKLGEDIYTPATPGDALRYMNNPTLDGYSRDYFPERIPETNNPTSSNDNGGVHGNSGIFNLAYVLLVQGGQHPRGKTTNQVTGIGLAKAEQIFYRANDVYFTSSTNYTGALNGAVQAATDLYGAGSAEVASVISAFCAVGVGTTCSGGASSGPALTGLTASSVRNGRTRWDATMTATVSNSGGSVSGVVVAVSTSTGATGSCTTTSTGRCSATLSRISNATANVTFTVTALNGNAGASGVPASVVANRP
jgi:vibriolysin